MSQRNRAGKAQARLRRASFDPQLDGTALLRITDHSRNESCAEDRLDLAVQHDQLAAEELKDAVLHARLTHDLTWEQIAGHLGLSRQAVQKRYAVSEQMALAEEEMTS